jgi:hypothetical protein
MGCTKYGTAVDPSCPPLRMSSQVGHAMNTVLEEANERIKFPLRKLFINFISPSVSEPKFPTRPQ